jgi:hypothetical protein
LASILGVTAQQVKATLFGTQSNAPPVARGSFRTARQASANRAANAPFAGRGRGFFATQRTAGQRKVINYSDFNLVSQEDDSGATVWFLEMNDGTFGQVTQRDATKIQNTHGTWIPGYVKRNSHGFTQSMKQLVVPKSAFALGGIVTAPGVRRFAEGGVVQAPGDGGVSKGGNTINQNFDVKTQGETDWGYVMRLGAVHAQESF